MAHPELLTQQNELMHDTAVQEAIRMQADYVSQALQAGEPVTFTPDKAMVTAENASQGLSQDLCRVIKAGDETFGIIKFNDASGHDPRFIVSRFGNGNERATIVGMLSEESSLNVGRNHQEGLDSTTSREHFSVGLRDSEIAVVDNGSTNGTELFKPRDIQEEIAQPQTPQKFSVRALRRVVGRFGKRAQVPAEIPADPLQTFENWAPKSAEVKAFIEASEKEPTSESYDAIGELVDNRILEAEKQSLEDRLRYSPELKQMHQLHLADKEATETMYKLRREGKDAEAGEYDRKSQQYYEQQRAMPKEVQAEYRRITERLHIMDVYHTRELSPQSPEAQTVFKLLETAPKLQDIDTSAAPFKDYEQNTSDTWKYVSEDEISDYLSKRIFKNTHGMSSLGAEPNKLSIRANKDESFDIPLDLVVHAQGFDSWMGRFGSGKRITGPYGKYYDGNQRSIDTIKHYASLPSELPPVSEIRVFMQPDGKLFCDNGSGDSHRIAAAMLRGDTTIKAERVTVQRLATNII